ncbi:MAG TPA: HAMP domain-containing sensor histidine kinase [Phenylobacterium sp.]
MIGARLSAIVNLIAIGLVVGAFTTIPWFVGNDLPDLNRLIVQAYAVVFVAVWLMMMMRPVPASGVGRVAWPFSSPFVVWAGNVLLAGAFWLWMPYADEGVLMACIVCQICTVTVYIMTTIEPPPSRGRIVLTPLVLPISIALYLLVHPVEYSIALSVFIFSFAATIVVLQRFVQQAVDDTFLARRAAEAALVQVAAERDAKTRFLASASHDLGQPLQAARLSFDQALRSPDPVRRERAAKRVGWAFDATEQLLRQMLDHLRLESGAVEARLDDVAVGPLIAHIAEMNEPAAKLAGLDLHVMPSRLWVRADPALTERALGNLVANAIRHSKGRRVLVGARLRQGRVRLWVIDDGVGVAAADASKLFEEYAQGSNHGDEIRGGFGLGLASARRMANLMGGEVALEAKWLNGSAFWLELPLAQPKAG